MILSLDKINNDTYSTTVVDYQFTYLQYPTFLSTVHYDTAYGARCVRSVLAPGTQSPSFGHTDCRLCAVCMSYVVCRRSKRDDASKSH